MIGRRHLRWSIGFTATAATVVVVFWAFATARDPGDLTAIRAAAEKIRPLHSAKSKPGPNDWLARHKESGQTFNEYLSTDPNRPDGRRTTIYVLPLGEFTATQSRVIDANVDLLGRFYSVPVKRLEGILLDRIPPSARRKHPAWGGEQIHSLYVLDMLKPLRPDDAVALIAFTTSDLYPEPSWNFVFGQASLSERVGVWSLARFGDPATEYARVLARTLKLAVHETGHMFGMAHCTAYECGMNGSNHLAESDSQPLGFCAECEQKIWWACQADAVRRYASLVEFAQQHELKDAAEVWRKSHQALALP